MVIFSEHWVWLSIQNCFKCCQLKFYPFFSQVQRQITRDLVYKRAMIMSPNDTIAFQSAVNCWVCQKPLNDDRVRDHCHVTGKCFVDCENVSFTSHMLICLKGWVSCTLTRPKTDVDKIRLKKKMSGDLPATGYWICHGCVLGSEQWERSPVSHEWLHKGSLFTGHAKSYWVNFFLIMNLDIAPYVLQMYRKPLESNFLVVWREKQIHQMVGRAPTKPSHAIPVMFTCNPRNYAK